MSPSPPPSLRVARRLLRGGLASLACVDEVGRGALCGPVTVGAVLVTEDTRTAPQGVRDSKLLTAETRRRLVPRIQRWAPAHGVGHASPAEIDALGIMAALRLAGHRALAQLATAPASVLLDGNHDYLTPPAPEPLLELLAVPERPEPPFVLEPMPPVVTMIKADLRCAAVASASILAKVARDEIMIGLASEHPEYGWDENKGYAAPGHLAALTALGPTPHHRVSWRLPGCEDAVRAPALESRP